MALTNKRHLFLTGTRGAGKSTLLKELTAKPLPGFTTRVIPGEGVWMQDSLSGKRIRIGRFDPSLPGPENRMKAIKENLEGPVTVLLKSCENNDAAWVSMDEIGYLEAGCPGFRRALTALMEKKRLLASVRKQTLPFLQELLHLENACVVDLDNPFGRLGCVIMASGLGKRFGENKLLSDFGGRPLIDWILDASEGIFSRRVVVTRHEAAARLCEQRRIPVILHQLPARNDTVRIGLEEIGEDVDGCLFCPGDQPLLSGETLELMALYADGIHIEQLSFGNRSGAPVLFPRDLFDELKNLPQGRGGNVLIKKYPGLVRKVPAREENELWDIDTREELDVLKQYLKKI